MTNMKPTGNHTESDGDSHNGIQMRPLPNHKEVEAKYKKAFREAFLETLRGNTEGALCTYLFYDLDPESDLIFGGLDYDAPTILSGGRAWERRISENTHPTNKATSFLGSDRQLIAHALQHGLVHHLPTTIQLVSYGGGDDKAFIANEGQIIKAIQTDPAHEIENFCSVDILQRYVDGQVYIASRRYHIDSQGVRGDFLRNGRLAINKVEGATPVVTIFGGPFENVSIDTREPDILGQAETNAAIAWGKMNIQHGLGSFVVKTFDSDEDSARQEARYMPTKNFEAFELSFLARAIEDGVVQNQNYDVFEHWRLASKFDAAARANKLYAECKKPHTLVTDEGNFDFKVGDRRVVTLSHKWDKATHARVAQRAGYDVEFYEQPGNTNVLMLAKAVRDPEPDILNRIPYSRHP